MHDLYGDSPVRALAQHLGGPLEPGQVAFVTARAGVGKSALLVHLAVEHVRTHYDQVFRAATRRARPADRSAAMVAGERHRMIHTWVGRGFAAE